MKAAPLSLSLCRFGDRLRSRDGRVFTYVERVGGFYPHEVLNPAGVISERRDNGSVFYGEETEGDIVEVIGA